MPELRDEGYVKGKGKKKDFNPSRIIKVEEDKKIDPFTRKLRTVTKISVHPTYLMAVRYNKYRSLYQILPSETLHGIGIKSIDQFTREVGMVMGMNYEVGMNGIQMIVPESLPQHDSFDSYPKEITQWAKPRLFAPIPHLVEHVVAFDIEVDIPQRRVPNVFQVEFPISSIAIASRQFKYKLVLDDETRRVESEPYIEEEGVVLKIFKSEKKMIEYCISILLNCKQPFVSGFNIDGFDFPYLMGRAELFGLVYDEIWGRVERLFNSATKQHEIRIIKGITGKFIVDLYPFMSNPSIKNYAFAGKYDQNSLEDIAQGLLGTGKIVHEKWFNEMSGQELSFYNLKDTTLILDLLEYNNEIILQLMIMLMRLGGLTIEAVCRRMISATLKGYMDSLFREFNYLIPNRPQLLSKGKVESQSTTGKGFKGALVIDPSPEGRNTRGVHFNVWAVDYQSLYPSEIKNRNICFTTINCVHDRCKYNKVPELTHHICELHVGFLPSILGFIRDSRVYYFKPMSKTIPEFNVIEQTLKVLINAGYGVVSSEMFDYYCPPVGETVTAFGRRDIRAVFDKVEADGEEVLYADTDSAFINETDEEYINGLIEWVREETGLELGVDYVAEVFGLYRSKNYFMQIGDSFNVKGMVGKKKNTPPIIKEAFLNVLESVKGMTKENYSEKRELVVRVVKKYMDYIMNGSIDPIQFKITQAISKPPDKYTRPTPASRAGLTLANKMNDELERRVSIKQLVPAGSLIEYLYVDRVYNIEGGNSQIRPLSMTTEEMVDRSKYHERLLSTLSQVTLCFNITRDELVGQSNLNEWF